jgi:DNA primase
MASKTISDLRGCVDLLKSRLDIVQVMHEVGLERAGSDLYKANCCFHEENTPSLTVTPSKGLYHCFGCKASGDAISFYKDYYKMSTMEAIRALAQTYSIDISHYERELTPEETYELELIRVNERAAEIAHDTAKENQIAIDYLVTERGISMETLAEFKVGYSPSTASLMGSMQEFAAHLNTLELDKPTMWDNAIIYPRFDASGRIRGFKNRPLKKIAGMKFAGTSTASPLHQDEHIYGFHIARKHMKKGKILMVEGQHDVLQAHDHQIKHVTGADGTALNEPKLRMLEEYGVKEIVVIYDGDNAGKEASFKLASMINQMKTTIAVKIAMMPDGFDPDQFIKEKGRLPFLQVAHEAVYASQFLIDRVAAEFPTTNVTGKLDFIKRVQPVILNAPSFEQKFLMIYVAEKVGLQADTIEDMIRSEQAKTQKSLLYNIDGEMIVLGAMIRDENFRIDTMTEMRKDDWYLTKHGELFDILYDMDQANVPITIETVKVAINNKGFKQLFNDGTFIDAIVATLGDAKTIKEDLVDKSIRRKIIKQAENLQRTAQNLSERVVMVVEDHLDKVHKSMDSAMTDGNLLPEQGAKGYMDTLNDRMLNPNKIVGIELSSFKSITSMLNGIQKKKLITVAANQSVGKTTMLLNWLDDIAVTQKLPWAHFTLEMPDEEVTAKMIGMRAGVDNMRLARGNISQEEYLRVQQAAIDYHQGGLILNDKIRSLEGIMNEVRKLQRSHGIVGVSIDYIQLMSMERNKSKQRYEELGDISGGLKTDLANGMGLPVIILSQLNKGAVDKEVVKAEDGAGSYKIAQDSDVYITLKEKSQEDIETYGIQNGNLIANIDKNRGGTADILLDIYFQKEIQRMVEVR